MQELSPQEWDKLNVSAPRYEIDIILNGRKKAAIFQRLTDDTPALALVVFATHFFIDRYRLAVYWIKLVNWNFQSSNFGFPEDVPKFLSIWLMIIIDNIFHISINSLCIWAHFAR
jgi:hypothetical protein